MQSKADQQRVAGDLIHAQTMQPGHHLPSHDLNITAVVDITPSHCCVFRSLPLCRLGAVLELENILEEELEAELVGV